MLTMPNLIRQRFVFYGILKVFSYIRKKKYYLTDLKETIKTYMTTYLIIPYFSIFPF